MTAMRSHGFSHGLVFSAKPLEEDEIFEVIQHYYKRYLYVLLVQLRPSLFNISNNGFEPLKVRC